jgi:hypothetical protein
MLHVIKNCIEPCKTGIWGSQTSQTFPWEESMMASMNIQLASVEILISADQEQEPGIDHIASVLATPL